MRRRDFIGVLSGTILSPMVLRPSANAQQQLPLMGYLTARSAAAEVSMLSAFRKGLAETGYIENRNVAIEFRFADGEADRLAALAADIVRLRPAVIVVVGSTGPALRARAMDERVPIVFNAGVDPVRRGLVPSFNRPGGNTTGIFSFSNELTSKNLGLLHELVPKAKIIAFLTGRITRNDDVYLQREREVRDAAGRLGLQMPIFDVASERELEAALLAMARERPDAMLVLTGPTLLSHMQKIIDFADRFGIPAIYNRRVYPAAGGLMSYGDNTDEGFRLTGIYAGRILKGEKPADLPVFQTNKLEFVINLKTAKALGLTVPNSLLALADEVIE